VTTPDNNDTFVVYQPLGRQFIQADIAAIGAAAVSTTTAQLGVNAVQAGGTAWASGAITSAVFASGAITATAIAGDAIGASELATDAVTEIANAVWDMDATGHQTQGTFGQAIGDPVADANTIYGAVVTGAAGATVAADIIAIKAETASILVDTAEIGAAGAGLTDIATQVWAVDLVGGGLGLAGDLLVTTHDFTETTDGNVVSIKAKTDSLVFTVSGKVNANIHYVNNVLVAGTGAPGTEWGP
jgi:hypothetical protein